MRPLEQPEKKTLNISLKILRLIVLFGLMRFSLFKCDGKMVKMLHLTKSNECSHFPCMWNIRNGIKSFLKFNFLLLNEKKALKNARSDISLWNRVDLSGEKISKSKMKGSSPTNKHKLSGSEKTEVSLLCHHHSFQINKVKQKDKLNAWLCQHEPLSLLSKIKALMITNFYQHPNEKKSTWKQQQKCYFLSQERKLGKFVTISSIWCLQHLMITYQDKIV